jgi:hypothetical protein
MTKLMLHTPRIISLALHRNTGIISLVLIEAHGSSAGPAEKQEDTSVLSCTEAQDRQLGSEEKHRDYQLGLERNNGILCLAPAKHIQGSPA